MASVRLPFLATFHWLRQLIARDKAKQPCHDESWYQLKHGLQVWAITPIKVVCLTSPPSPREKESTAQSTPKRRWLRQVWKKSEFVTRGPSKLAKQPNNHKTVAHIINPGKITRFVHATDLAWQPQLKNQLTKSHESSLPTIGRDKMFFFFGGGCYTVLSKGLTEWRKKTYKTGKRKTPA